MHIFIDETGPFGIGAFPAPSLVGALIVPNVNLPALERVYGKIRRHLPKENGQVKGKTLDERQVARVVSVLLEHGAIFEAILIDLGTHTEEGLKQFQAAQAEKFTASLTDKHKESLVAQVTKARAEFEAFKLPAVVQAILTFELVWSVLEWGTMYLSTRLPKELESFHWVVDAKGDGDEPTDWEKWWSSVILPILQTKSFTDPMKQLDVGDYSHMARFDAQPDDFLRDQEGWQEGAPPLDVGKLLEGSLKFSPASSKGLELVDIVTNATSRALKGNLQQNGWNRIPELMLAKGRQYISLVNFQDDPVPGRQYPYQPILEAFGKGGRVMVPAHLREH